MSADRVPTSICYRRQYALMMLYLISFDYIFTPALSSASFCPGRLMWHEKSFIEDTQSFRLQICCNVTRLWFVQLTSDWRLASYNGGDWQWKNVETLTLPGFDLILSKCGNQTMLGDVVSSNCTQERGKIITLAQNVDQLPEFDQWYVSCYESMKNDRRCVVCILDKFCTNHGRCRETFVHVEVVNASLTSFTVLLHVGDIPFDAEINVEVSDAFESYSTTATNASKKEIYYKNFPVAIKNKTLAYKLTDLKMDTWYKVNVCTVVRTPAAFRSNYPNIILPDEHIFCIKEERKTLWMKHLSKGAQSLSCDRFFLLCTFLILLPLSRSVFVDT